MKKLLLFALLMLNISSVWAQNQVISKLKQPPPNRFGIADLWSLELNNLSRKEVKGYIVGTLSEDKDGLIVEGRSKTFTIKPGRTTYTYNDFSDADIQYRNNKYREILLRTGGAPDGDYTICVTVYNEFDEVIGQENCIYHSVRTIGNISLVMPTDNEQLPENQPIVFSWTPLPNQNEYSLKIVELLGNQNPESAIKNNRAFFQRDGIRGTSFQYPISERKFELNKTYLWQVYLKENPDVAASEIWSFRISEDSTDGNTLRQLNFYSCNNPLEPIVITNNTADNKNASDYVNNFIKVGNFKMKVLNATGTSSSLNGNGSIVVPWLKTPIAVVFSGIKINSDTVMYSGEVFSDIDQTPEQWPVQWGINVVGNFNWTTTQVKKLDTWLHNNLSGWSVTNKLVKDFDLNQMVQNYTNNPLKLPLGFNNIKGYTIAIAEMKFEPTQAKLNCLAVFPVENDTLAFKASDIPFGPGGPSTSAGQLALIEDVSIMGNVPNGDSYEIVIKKATGKQIQGVNKGTFINWDCEGFNTLNIEIDILFPRTWLKPIPDNGQKVKSDILTVIEHWDDLIAQTTLPKCQIVGTAGVELQVDELWFDNSISLNPTSISFPTNYPVNLTQGNDFKGFFLKQAKARFPNNVLSTSNQPIEITFSNMIINKQGLTGAIFANNLLTFPNGKISGMSASVDSLKLILLCSSITDAYLRGKIVLPVSVTNKQNALLYKINLMNSNGLQVTLTPLNPITAKLFGDSKFTLSNTSTFDMWLNNNLKFLLKLNGEFEFANINLGNIKNVNMKMTFQNLKLDYDENRSQQAGKLNIDAGQWSFASPQKSIAKFPITIKNIKYEKRTAQGNELLRGALSFRVDLNINEKFTGNTSLSVIGYVKKNNNGIFVPTLHSVELDTINLAVNLPAVKLNGKIAFFNEDQPNGNIYGNGFSGNIKATFNSIQMEVSSNFRAGSTKYNNGSNYYRYWFVEAKAILPKQYGIAFLPGLAFYGFGAAAWQRINVSNIPMPSASEVQNSSSISNTTNSGATFTPDKNIGFGFKAMAVIGTYPEPKTFNLDAALSAQFSTNGGLNKISFVTNFWAMAELIKRNTSPIYGDVSIEYTPPDKLFIMNANAFIKYPSSNPFITTAGIGNPNDKVNLTLYVNGKTNKWYFLAGKPTQTNKVKILGVTSWEYAMFGNDIGQFVRTGFQQTTLNGLASAGVNLPPATTQTPPLAGSGRGFSFGAGVNYSVNKSLNMGWLSWAVGGRIPQLRYGGGGGFEINLSLLEYGGCNGNTIGMNNWYATGSVAAWLYGYAKVWLARKKGVPCVFCCKIKGAPESGCEATLAALKAGFWTQAGFPNPSYVQGSASVYVNVFGLNWSGSVDINWGSPCSNIQNITQTQTFTQENATDKIGNLIISVNPQNNDVINPAKKIEVTTAYKFGDIFEIPEIQSDGTIKTRSFILFFNGTLNKIVTIGSGQNLMDNQVPQNLVVSAQPNNMGAYEYYIFRPAPNFPYRNLDDNSRYQFQVNAVLWEYVNGNWVKAKDKNNNFISETKTVTFQTSELGVYQQPVNPNPPTGNN